MNQSLSSTHLLSCFLIVFTLLFTPRITQAQGFCSDYGQEVDEKVLDMTETSDGDMVLVGWRENLGNGARDLHVVKIDALGNVVWARTLLLDAVEGPGTVPTVGRAVIEDSNNELVIVGHTENFSGTPQLGLMVRMDLSGTFLQTTVINDDGSSLLSLSGVSETDNGELFISGRTRRPGRSDDFYIARVTAPFAMVWSGFAGGPGRDIANEIVTLPGDRLAVVGVTEDPVDGDLDWLLIGVQGDGSITLGSLVYGGARDDFANDIIELPNGTKLVVGSTFSASGGAQLEPLVVAFDVTFSVINDLVVTTDTTDAGARRIVQRPNQNGFFVTGEIQNPTSSLMVLALDITGFPVGMRQIDHTGGADLTGGFVSILTNNELSVSGTSQDGDSEFFVSHSTNGTNCCSMDRGFLGVPFEEVTFTGPAMTNANSFAFIRQFDKKDETTRQPLCPSPKRFAGELEENGAGWKVYPNPVREQLTISWEGEGSAQLTLVDPLGRVVREQMMTAGEQTISVRELPAGVYFLRALTDKQNFTRQVIVN